MRTLRTTLATTAIVALLLGLAATAVLSQDDQMSGEPVDFIFVEGREINGGCAESECHSRQEMSDPRVSGELDIQLDLGCSIETICWMGGDLTITNDDGGWDGRWVGFIGEDGSTGRSHDIMQWFEGTGAYEGWSYVAVLTDLERPITDVRGVLYRGDLPPSVAQDLVALAE